MFDALVKVIQFNFNAVVLPFKVSPKIVHYFPVLKIIKEEVICPGKFPLIEQIRTSAGGYGTVFSQAPSMLCFSILVYENHGLAILRHSRNSKKCIN